MSEKTTFKKLFNETKINLALHYLHKSDLELCEIAYLVGYQDINSFYRAFNNWTGEPPKQYRNKHQ